jgi:hypothetical protein
MPAGRYCREKRPHGRVDGFTADHCRSITESKLRIRSEQLNETGRVAGVDHSKHPLPPCAIRLKERLWCDGFIGRYHLAQHTRRRDNVLTYSG